MNHQVAHDLQFGKCNWSLQTHIVVSTKADELCQFYNVDQNSKNFYKNYHQEHLTPDYELYNGQFASIQIACKPAYYHYFDELMKKYGDWYRNIGYYAALYGNLKLLLKYYPIKSGTFEMLIAAALGGNLEIFKRYYNTDPYAYSSDDEDYEKLRLSHRGRLLCSAVKKGNVDIANFLFSQHDFSYEINKILKVVADENKVDMVEFLIENGADVKELKIRHLDNPQIKELVCQYVTF